MIKLQFFITILSNIINIMIIIIIIIINIVVIITKFLIVSGLFNAS